MKKHLSLVIILFISLSFGSCDSDDDGGNTPAADPVVGTWQLSEISQNTVENGVVVSDESFSASTCNSDIFFTFVNGGQLTTTDFEIEFNLDFNGNPSLDCNVFNGDLSGGWERLTGNTYSITIDGDTQQVTITFSNNNNTFDFSFSFTETFDGDTVTETITLRGNRV